jgi:hypothetical protein
VSSPSVRFGDYWSLLRRRWPSVLAGLAVGLVVAGLVLATAPRRYESSADVLVLPLRTDLTAVSSSGALETVNLDTEAQIVRSAEVLAVVRAELGGTWTAEQLANDVRVTAPASTTILTLAFPASSPAEAQRGAVAFAHAYLASRTAEGSEIVAGRRRALQANIDALRDELERVAPAAEFSANPVDRALADARRDVLIRDLNSVTGKYQQLSTTPLNPGRIVHEPTLPDRPESPVPELVGPSGVMAGLLIGLALAGLRDQSDRRVRNRRPEGLAPLLGQVDGAQSAAGREFEESRRIVNQLLIAVDRDPALRVVLVLPVGAPGGVLSTELAVVAAQSGRKTLLIPNDTSAVPAVPELTVTPPLPTGDDGPLGELVRPVLVAGRESHQLVVIEAPPVDRGSDAQTLASWSDGVIVVFAPGVTRRDELATALAQLDRVGAPVLGSIAVKLPTGLARLRARRSAPSATPDPEPAPAADPVPAGRP